MSHSTQRRIDTVVSQLQLNNTVSQSDTGILESPFESVTIPDNLSFHQFLFHRWKQENYAQSKALTFADTGETWTYQQLQNNIIHLSNALYELGIRPRQVVAIYSANCIEYKTVEYACSVLGAIACLINPVYTGQELIHHLNDSQAVYLFTQSGKLDVVNQVKSKAPGLKHVYTFDQNKHQLKTWHDMLKQGQKLGDTMLHEAKINPKEDIQILPYSSGTTGLAKGVMLTHYNLISNILQLSDVRYYEDVGEAGEVIMCVLPMYHIFAANYICNTGLYGGHEVVMMSAFIPDKFLGAIQKYKVTRAALVPPLINFLTKSPLTQKFDLSSIKVAGSGAAPLTTEIEQEFQNKFKHIRARQGFGMTECPVTHSHPIGQQRIGSIGKLISNMEAKLVDTETNKPVQANKGQRGELWLRGPNVMKGYWRNEKSTKDTIDSDGFLHTGDVAYVDNDGYYYIVDGVKELIKVKGLQVAPAELEGLLLSHPDIDDAAVIQVPDERAGELPRAYIVKRQGSSITEQQVKDYIAKQVAPHKKLDGGVKFIQQIPKAQSGKILRRELRELAKKD